MKKSELFFAILLVPVDFIMIIAASVLAFWFRFTPNIIEIKPVLFDFPFESYLKVAILVAPFFLLIFALEGLYSLKSTRVFWKEFIKIVFSVTVGVTFVVLLIFLQREWFSSRFVILTGWLLAIILITISRYVINFIQKLLLHIRGRQTGREAGGDNKYKRKYKVFYSHSFIRDKKGKRGYSPYDTEYYFPQLVSM